MAADYVILEAEDEATLETAVEAKLDAGYSLAGGCTRGECDDGIWRYRQAVFKL